MFFLLLLLGPGISRGGNLSRALFIDFTLVPSTDSANQAFSPPDGTVTDGADGCGGVGANNRRCLLSSFLGLGLATAFFLEGRDGADLAPTNKAHGIDIDRRRSRAER